MTVRPTNFEEVSFSLSDDQDTPTSTHKPRPSSLGVVNILQQSRINNRERRGSSLSLNRVSRLRSVPRMASKGHATRGSARSIASVVTIQDFDSDSADQVSSAPPPDDGKSLSVSFATRKDSHMTTSQMNLLSIGRPLSQLRNVIRSATNLQKIMNSSDKDGPETPMEEPPKIARFQKKVNLEKRFEIWEEYLKSSMDKDIEGHFVDAFEAYKRFNRQITKELIAYFQILTCDQQKMINRILISLDRRCQVLQVIISNQGKDALRLSPSSSCSSCDKPDEDATLNDLCQCISLLSAVKKIGSNQKIPVVLVYRQRRHRVRHRHQEKGQSNQVVFPREKREFLQVLGLPGKMVNERGIDFTIQPATEFDVPPRPLSNLSDHSARDDTSNVSVSSNEFANKSTNEGDRTSLSNKNAKESTGTNGLPKREGSKLSIVDQWLNFKKRLSISPQRADGSTSPLRTRQNTKLDDLGYVLRRKKLGKLDTTSMLTCDSCSSNESSGSDYEQETHTDTAANSSYFHRDTLLSNLPKDEEETYVTFVIEKIGVKNTSLISPFLRVSLRDGEGGCLSQDQETGTWEIMSRYYLKCPSPVLIQESLESLPDDMAIFFELRHHLQEKGKISTHCYTFLEKSDLKSGDFVCEIYRPPVDYTKKELIPYSTKALFLHLEIQMDQEE